MNLEIGKIIYVLNNNPPKLLPGRVVEQIISRKVDREVVTHVVKFANDKDYTLENIKKPWFPSLETARSYLVSEAEKLIEAVISDGQKRAVDHFDKVSSFANLDDKKKINKIEDRETPSSHQLDQLNDTPGVVNSTDLVVDLGNGQKAKVKMPEVLKP